MPQTNIAHVRTYDPRTGIVNCFRHNDDLDFFFTGTIRTVGAGNGTCKPSTRTFDIILHDASGVVPGCKLLISYEDTAPGLTKPVTNINVQPVARLASVASNARASAADCGEVNAPVRHSPE